MIQVHFWILKHDYVQSEEWSAQINTDREYKQ